VESIKSSVAYCRDRPGSRVSVCKEKWITALAFGRLRPRLPEILLHPTARRSFTTYHCASHAPRNSLHTEGPLERRRPANAGSGYACSVFRDRRHSRSDGTDPIHSTAGCERDPLEHVSGSGPSRVDRFDEVQLRRGVHRRRAKAPIATCTPIVARAGVSANPAVSSTAHGHARPDHRNKGNSIHRSRASPQD